MAQQNQVVRRGGVVVKTFASHLNYLRESGIYEKLEGSDLAPRVLYAGSNTIEHVFIEGDTLKELLNRNAADPSAIAGYFNMFFEWYSQFRARTGNSIENISFSKFIVSDGKLRYVDFEHCRADFAEKDVATLAAAICLSGDPFSFKVIELCRLFICLGTAKMSLDTERLSGLLSKELIKLSQENNIEYSKESADYLIQGVTTCGLLFADDPKCDASSALQFLSTLPQRIAVCHEKGKPGFPSFEDFETGVSPVDSLYNVSRLIKRVKQPWSLWLNAGEKYDRKQITELMACEKEGYDAVICAPEASGRIYPMIVRTDTLGAAADNALSSGATNLKQAMSVLNVKYV